MVFVLYTLRNDSSIHGLSSSQISHGYYLDSCQQVCTSSSRCWHQYKWYMFTWLILRQVSSWGHLTRVMTVTCSSATIHLAKCRDWSLIQVMSQTVSYYNWDFLSVCPFHKLQEWVYLEPKGIGYHGNQDTENWWLSRLSEYGWYMFVSVWAGESGGNPIGSALENEGLDTRQDNISQSS